MTEFVDTHAHIDGEEFQNDLPDVIERAKAAGVGKILLPSIDLESMRSVLSVCQSYPEYVFPMIGLQPEEVKDDWRKVLDTMYSTLARHNQPVSSHAPKTDKMPFIAIGEVGLDFYWSRQYEKEQLQAFERQVEWAVEYHLPLMIHCRKAQNELLHLMKPYEQDLVGGVFHCFTGNQKEAAEFLKFDKFVLGIGGVLTFKSSHLREDLPASVPLNRIVLETDSPYMSPVPYRGKRNESAYVKLVLEQLALCYGVSDEEVARQTNINVERIFGKL